VRPEDRWYHGGVLIASLLVALQIQAVGDCPGAIEIERELGRLLGDEAVAHDVATIAQAGDGSVSLTLTDTSGQPIGARTLPRARTCGEQAKAVAVTVAVWEAQLHPEITLGLDRLASAPPPRSGEMAVVARVAPPPPVAPQPAPELMLGAAVMADVQSGGWAPAARLDLARGNAGSRWRARLALGGVCRHQMNLSPGHVSWWRAFVQVGADVEVVRGPRSAVVVGAGIVGGMVSVAGAGFPVDHATRSLDVGGEGRARLEARLGDRGHLRPWVGATVAVWARRQGLDVQGGASSALPRVEPMGGLGAEVVW
jgi:hypothetical protein